MGAAKKRSSGWRRATKAEPKKHSGHTLEEAVSRYARVQLRRLLVLRPGVTLDDVLDHVRRELAEQWPEDLPGLRGVVGAAGGDGAHAWRIVNAARNLSLLLGVSWRDGASLRGSPGARELALLAGALRIDTKANGQAVPDVLERLRKSFTETIKREENRIEVAEAGEPLKRAKRKPGRRS